MSFFKYNLITINGYRRLYNTELRMRPLSVMIGENGAGKTSLLEVFSLLADSAKGKLQQSMSRLGGIQELLTIEKSKKISFGLSILGSDKHPIYYDVSLQPKGNSYEISSEKLYQKDQSFDYIQSTGTSIKYYNSETKRYITPNWAHSYLETSLSQVPKMYEISEIFRTHMASCQYYSANALSLGHDAPIRLPQKMQPVTDPGKNGEYLVSCLYHLRETSPELYEAIEDTLCTAFPGFKKLNFPPVATGTIAMTWTDKNYSIPLYSSQLSEGMLRFLWLVTILYCSESNSITLVDEPEVSLHPQLLCILSDIFREVSRKTHLFIATHSCRLIRFMHPSEVIVIDSENGQSQLKWADNLRLDNWLNEYNLDELWTMGRLGGKS